MTTLDLTGAREIAHRYAAAIDDGDLDTALALFAADADLLLPDPPTQLEPITQYHGPEEIRRALSSVFAVRATIHEITGQVVELSGLDATGADRTIGATGRITGVAHHYLEDPSRPDRPEVALDLQWRIRYDDSYVLQHGQWLIAARSLTVLAVERHPVRTVLPRGGIRLLP